MEIIRSGRSGYSGYRFNQKRSRRIGKRALLTAFSFLFVILGSVYAVVAINKDVVAVTAEPLALTKQAEAVDITWPSTGQAAIGDLQDGVLVSSGSTEAKKPIASITKLITALAVLEKQPLKSGEQGPRFTIGSADVENYQEYVTKLGSVMQVSSGQVLTEYQALQALLLVSANNIADSLVTWVFGSMQNFLAFVKDFCVKNGWDNTSISDASGFSPSSQSTPSDLIKIGQKALQNPVIAEIVAQREATIPGSGVIKNTNQMLFDTGVVGIKTGSTDEAGNCLLFAVKHGPSKEHTLLGVVMGQPGWSKAYQAARNLRDSALSSYKEVELLPAGSVVGSYKTIWGSETDAITKTAIRTYVWAGKQHQITISLNELNIPTKQGEIVGKAGVAQENFSTVDIVAESSLLAPSFIWRLAHYW